MKLWLLAVMVFGLVVGPVRADEHEGDDGPGYEEEARPEKGRRGGKGRRGKHRGKKARKAPKEVQEFRKKMRGKQQEFRKGIKEKHKAIASKLKGLDGEKCRQVRKEELQALKSERMAHREEMEAEKAAFVEANPEAGRFFDKARGKKGKKGMKGKKGRKGKRMAKKRGAMNRLKCKGDKKRGKGKKGKRGKKKGAQDDDEENEYEDQDDEYEDDE
jgi:hypothetical protein